MAGWRPLVRLLTLLPQRLDKQLRQDAGIGHVYYSDPRRAVPTADRRSVSRAGDGARPGFLSACPSRAREALQPEGRRFAMDGLLPVADELDPRKGLIPGRRDVHGGHRRRKAPGASGHWFQGDRGDGAPARLLVRVTSGASTGRLLPRSRVQAAAGWLSQRADECPTPAHQRHARSTSPIMTRAPAGRPYRASVRTPDRKSASSSCASSGSTEDTYWSGRTTTTQPVSRSIPRVSKMSGPAGSGQNTFS